MSKNDFLQIVQVSVSTLKASEYNPRRWNESQAETLKEFDETFLKDAGFSTEELDEIFDIDPTPERFDLEKELAKAGVTEVTAKKGDVYECSGFRLMVGDSTVEADMLKLMNGEKADMCFTDPPYILDYLRGKKKNGKP